MHDRELPAGTAAGRVAARIFPISILGGLLVSVVGLLGLAGTGVTPSPVRAVTPDVVAVRTSAWVDVPGGRVQRLVAVTPQAAPGLAERRDAVRKALVMAPSLTATMQDVIVPGTGYDDDGEGDLDPGEKLVYHVEIANGGPDPATNVVFTMPSFDASTELVANSRMTSPVAFDDAYAAIGNVQLVVAVGDGVIQGTGTDVDPDGDVLSVTGIDGCVDTTAPFDCATTSGGAVSMAADGAFTYTPPVGFEGSDTFVYVLSDGTTLPDDALGGDVDVLPDPMPTSSATVTFSVAEVIWFVDDGAAGTGHSHAPFTLDQFNNTALDETGDFIFIRSGDHSDDGTIQLLDNQKLVGEDVSLETFFLANDGTYDSVPLGATLPGDGTAPTVTNTAGHVVTLGNGNTIAGLTLRPQAGAGIAGGSTAATNVSTVTIEVVGTTSDGISLSGHSGTFTFDNGVVTTGAGSSSGVAVEGVNSTGAVNVTNSTISFAGGRIVGFDNMEGGASFNGTTVTSTDHDGVSVTNSNAGTIALPAFTIAPGTPAGVDAILLTNNNGATISLGVVNVNTSGARALVASGGGTINLSGTTSSLSAMGTRAVDLNGVTVGNGSGGAMTFGSVSSASTASEGVLLTSLAGSLAMNGGAITRAGGATGDAFQVSSGNADVTYGGTISNGVNNAISVAGTTGGTVTFNSAAADAILDSGTGIFLNGAAGNVTVGADAELTGSEGIDVDGGSGTFTFADTDINLGSAGVAVDVSGGTASLDFQAGSSVTHSQSTTAVNINSNTGGTATFSGAVSASTATATAVNLTSNSGGTVTFGGGLALATSSGTAFNATGSGTVNVSGGTRTINTSTGRALNIVSVNAGVSGIHFGSVTVTGGATAAVFLQNTSGTKSLGTVNVTTSGPTAIFASQAGTLNTTSGTLSVGNGVGVDVDNTTLGVTLTAVHANGGVLPAIDLATTGGSFTVAGDGGGSSNGSGGTIQNKSGHAILLSNASNVSLGYMNLTSNGGSGVDGTTVTGFTINRSNLTTNGDIAGEAGLKFVNLLGTASISNTTVTASGEHNVNIVNNTGTLTMLTVSNSTFQDTKDRPQGADGFLIVTQSTAVATALVQNSTFADNYTQGMQGQATDNSSLTVTFRANSVTNNNEGVVFDHSTGGDLNVTVGGDAPADGNTFSGHQGPTIVLSNASTTTSSASLIGKIKNNIVTTNSALGSAAVSVFTSGTNTPSTLNISYNTVTNSVAGHVILVDTPDATTTSPQVSVTANNNNVTGGGLGGHGVLVQARKASTVCVLMQNNTGTVAGGSSVARVRSSDTGLLRLKKGVSTSSTASTVIQENNPGVPTTASQGTGSTLTVVENNACSTPTASVAREHPEWENLAEQDDASGAGTPSIAFTGDEGPDVAIDTPAGAAGEQVAVRSTVPALVADRPLVSEDEAVAEEVPALAPTGVEEGSALASIVSEPVSAALSSSAPPQEETRAASLLLASAGGGVDALDLAKARVREREARLAARDEAASPEAAAPAAAPRAFVGEFPVAIGTLPAGKEVHVFFEVVVDDPLAAGVTTVSNQGNVTADGGIDFLTDDPDVGGASDPTVTSLDAAAVLTLTKDADVTEVTPGGTITYTLTYGNTGNQNVAAAVLRETVPTGTTYEATGSDAGWSCADGDPAGTVCTLSGLAVNGGQTGLTADFVVTVVSPAAAGLNDIDNAADIFIDNDAFVADTPAATGSESTTLNAAPDLSISVGAGDATTTPGGTLTFTLTYDNVGDQDATGVAITEIVPVGTTFDAGASSGGWTCTDQDADLDATDAGSECTFSVGALGASALASDVTFGLQILQPLSPATTSISNQASIVDDDLNGADPTPANDTDTEAFALPYGVLVNEIDYDQGDPDDAEFVELVNTTGGAVDLTAYEVHLVPDVVTPDPGAYVVAVTGGAALVDGGFYLLCVNAAGFVTVTCDQDLGAGPVMTDDAGAVALVHTATGLVVDAVAYEGDVPGYTETAALVAADDATTDFAGLSRLAGPQDTNDNSTDFTLACVTPGATNVTDTSGCSDPLPVEMASFTATTDGAAVVLAWETASETNNAGFDVEHRLSDETEWRALGFVEGAGTTGEARQYRYRVDELAPGRHSFRLRQVDFDGVFTYTATVEVETELPRQLALMQNYPNPFNPVTTIAFTVPDDGRAVVRLFNVLGKEVAVLYDAFAQGGKLHEVRFAAEGFPTGSYVYTLDFNGRRVSRSFVLLK